MKTIEISEQAFIEHIPTRRLSDYRRHVVENGHKPGILSGAELTSLAKEGEVVYARSRRAVTKAVQQATGGTVVARWHYNLYGGAMLWTDDATGDPVRLSLV